MEFARARIDQHLLCLLVVRVVAGEQDRGVVRSPFEIGKAGPTVEMFAIGSGVSETSPPPSARTRYRRSRDSSGGVRRKTILVPSRDHTGSVSFSDPITIAVVTPFRDRP